MAESALNLKDLLLRSQEHAGEAPEYMTQSGAPLSVVLIQPPSTDGVQSLLPQVEEGSEGIGFKPPLGILYVASQLEARSHHKVHVIDAIAQQLSFEELLQRVISQEPDVVGISAWTDFWYPAWLVGRMIKSALPDVHLTYGGPHVGIYPQETLDIDFIDSVIVGDGEVPFLYLCNMLSNEVEDNSFPGLHFAEHGVKPQPDTFYIHKDLDDLPIPNRSLLPISDYGSVLSRGNHVTTMITSRGCPHRCTFCKLNFQKTLCRSAESVIEEFRQIEQMNIREVEIYDDTFTWGKQRLRDICNGIIDADIKVEWAVRDRVSSADPELLKLMARAGCTRIHFGIESGSQKIIDKMQKRIKLEQARDAVKYAKEAGMTVLTYWMFGNLEETEEDIAATIAFSKELSSDYAEFSITIPYAGTEMYEEALRSGIIEYDYWLEYALKPTAKFVPPQLIENHVSLEKLLDAQRHAVRSFYFRPHYIFRELTKLKSFSMFLKRARMGARLFNSVYVK